MHLNPRYGNTLSEIIADGFPEPVRIPIPDSTDSPVGAVGAMARCMEGMAAELDRLRPDLIVILGDRFEMLATATAALMLRIPIVHIAGGEISEGAIDDSIRHAITKMSALHLTATEPYRQRVVAMGEAPERVINTGAIGVYNIMHEPLMTREELEASVGMALPEGSMLVTYHPATLDDSDPATHCDALLAALDRFPGSNVIITYPNNDSHGRVIIDRIEAYGRANPGRVRVIPSLGKLRYTLGPALRLGSGRQLLQRHCRSTVNGHTYRRRRHPPARTSLRRLGDTLRRLYRRNRPRNHIRSQQ